jgi:hypothetical protein
MMVESLPSLPRDAQRAAHSTEVASQGRSILPFFLVKGVKYLYLMETEEQ